MAIDDAVEDVIYIESGGSDTDFQPASGVEVMITSIEGHVSGGTTDEARISIRDGNGCFIYHNDKTAITSTDDLFRRIRQPITNDHYLRFSRSGSTDDLAYAYGGIQIN